MAVAKLIAVFTLVVLAVGVLASEAQAAEWDIEGETLSELKLSEAAVTISGGPISIMAPSKSFVLKCESASGTGVLLPGGVENLTESLSECNLSSPLSCKGGKPTAVIKAKLKLIEAGGAYYYKLEPQEGTTLITVSGVNEECVFGEQILVKGNVAAQPLLQMSAKQSLKFSEELTKSANKALKGQGEAELELSMLKITTFLSGEFLGALSGKLAGLEWQAFPFTRACKDPPLIGTSECQPTKLWPEKTAIVAKQLTEMHFDMGAVETTCSVSKFEGETTSAGAAPLLSILRSMTFEECNNKCTVAVVVPRLFSFAVLGRGGNGDFGFQHLEIEFTCAGINCVYGAPFLQFQVFSGGAPATVSSGVSKALERLPESDEVCAAPATWKGIGGIGAIEYKFESPTSLYLTER